MLGLKTHDHTDQAGDYLQRVNRAIDYVVRHLAEPLSLQDVAAAACFSAFHFHRVFKTLVGETLNQFIKRLRLERALYLMSHAPKRSLTSVALDCGFSSSIDFTRNFRQHYGVAPSQFDLQQFRDRNREAFERTFSSHHSQLTQSVVDEDRSSRITALPMGQNPDGFTVRLRDLPARTVAYIRVFDPYREGAAQAAIERLLTWAIKHGVADAQWLGYMWDEPEIVALANCRYDVAVVVDQVVPSGEIGRFDFPPMRVAEVAVSGDLALEARAIDWLYQTWLPQSNYLPDDQPAFEAWIGRPFAHGTAHFEIAVQLPIKRS
jgi:AraC family transcriptional regulator